MWLERRVNNNTGQEYETGGIQTGAKKNMLTVLKCLFDQRDNDVLT
jgi:hypothetical protein